MHLSHARSLLLLPLLAAATPLAAESPTVLVCRGHEPEWNLRIDGSKATLATLGGQGLVQTGFLGQLQEIGWARPPFLVYRGRADAPAGDLVAVLTREQCLDTMADAADGGGASDHTARVSLPDGEVRLGCCAVPQVPVATTPPVPVTPAPPAPPAPAPAPASPAPAAPAPAATPVAAPHVLAPSTPGVAAGGEITALTLPDGTVCRSTGRGATLAFEGRRLNFDCGSSGVDKLGLLGPVTLGPGGLLQVQKAEIMWTEGLSSVRKAEATLARASEIALGDGLTCRLTGRGATLAFEGRRASFTCGMRDGDTIALLGDPEAAEGGFRIVRARIAQGPQGFTLASSEPIVVTAPR